MLKTLKIYFARWRTSKNIKHDLDAILSRANPNARLQERLLWLVDLLQWVRFQRVKVDYEEVEQVRLPSARLRFLLRILDRNENWKSQAAKTLRSIVREVRSLDLFLEVGLPQNQGFWTELKSRLVQKVMPEPPLSESMSNLFSALFPNPEDSEWLTSLEKEDFEKLVYFFVYDLDRTERGWNNLERDLEGAILILSSQIQALGYSPEIRKRLEGVDLADLPFHRLPIAVELVLEAYKDRKNKEGFREATKEFYKVTRECVSALDKVYRHLDRYGVSLSVVYSLDAGSAKLKRIDDLVSFLLVERADPEAILHFFVQLIYEHQANQSLSQLFNENTKLLSRKIVDRSAETGETYITRNREDFWRHFRKAAGGGVITAGTVYIKFFTTYLKLPLFFDGFFSSINYAVSFTAIQLSGYTLATKQPAMTAPAIAAKMNRIDSDEGLQNLVDEIVNLVRSQFVAVLGNVGLVIPTVILIEMASFVLFRSPTLAEQTASYIFESINFLGPTPVFAALTGVLLWASSLVSGWTDNWFVLNKMKATISFNRKLNFILGTNRCQKIADFFEKNISGIAGCVSLGVFLGLIPAIMSFFGIYFDVRHVTLASGSLTAAFMHFGRDSFFMLEFWSAVIGIGFIGTLNVGISFILAFIVAIRARQVEAPQRMLIYRALWQRFKRNPRSLFYPEAKTRIDSKLGGP